MSDAKQPGTRNTPEKKGLEKWLNTFNLMAGLIATVSVTLIGGAINNYYEYKRKRAEAEQAEIDLIDKKSGKKSSDSSTVAAEPRKPVSPIASLEAVKLDLERTPAENRKSRRYLSLIHLHNDSRVTDETLASAREAMRELAAYLSPPGTVAGLHPLDETKVVVAIDLSEFGIDAAEAWPVVLRGYPYGLEGTDPQAKAVRKLSGTPLAIVRGDWFVRAAVRSPLASPGKVLHRSGGVPPALRTFAQQYDEQRIDSARAAAELGVDDPTRVVAAVRKEEHLREPYKLTALAEGGSVSRASWESLEFLTSPFQELAGALKVGTPLRAE